MYIEKKTFTVTVSRNENREEKKFTANFYAVDVKIDITNNVITMIRNEKKIYDDE